MTFGNYIHDKSAAASTVKHAKLAKPGKRRPFAIATYGKFYVVVVLKGGKPSAAVSFLRKMKFDEKEQPKEVKGESVSMKAFGLLSRAADGGLVIEAKEEVTDAEFAGLNKYFKHFKLKSPFKPPPGYSKTSGADEEDIFTDTPEELAAAEQDAEAAPVEELSAGENEADGAPPADHPPATDERPALPQPPDPKTVLDAYLTPDLLQELAGPLNIDWAKQFKGQDMAALLEQMNEKPGKLLQQILKRTPNFEEAALKLLEMVGNKPESWMRDFLGLPDEEPAEEIGRLKDAWLQARSMACLRIPLFQAAVEARLGEEFEENASEYWSAVNEFGDNIGAMVFPAIPASDTDAEAFGSALHDAREVIAGQASFFDENANLVAFIDDDYGDYAPSSELKDFRQEIGRVQKVLDRLGV